MATETKSLKTSKSMPKVQIYSVPSSNEEEEKTQTKKKKALNSVADSKKKPLAPKNVSNNGAKKAAGAAAAANKTKEKEEKAPGKKTKAKSGDVLDVRNKENRPPTKTGGKGKKTENEKTEAAVGPNLGNDKKVAGRPKKGTSTAKETAGGGGGEENNENSSEQPKRATKKKSLNVGEGSTASNSSGKKSSGPTNSPKKTKKNFQTDRDIAILESIFPNIDPSFLKAQYVKMKRSVEDTINLISGKKPGDKFPVRTIQLKKSDVDKIQSKYTTDFRVDEYLKAIPDPWNYFLNTELHNSIRYADLSLDYLKNKFPKHYIQTIRETLINYEYSLYRAFKELSSKRKSHLFKMRLSSRKSENSAPEPTHVDFQFLQEVAFIEHEDEIIDHIKKLESEKVKKLKNVLKTRGLLKCQNCDNGNVVWENVTYCGDNHVVCRDCLNRHIMMEIGSGNFDFKCPLYCRESLTLTMIQDVLSPEIMAIIVRKLQLDELKSAGISDVDYCPACYYTKLMPPPDQHLFYCLNPTCMKISCRLCKREEHEPYECDAVKEVETFEFALEPASPMICFQCEKEYIKKENSNEMICACGSVMCYTCRQPFLECAHFKLSLRQNDYELRGKFKDEEEVEGKGVGTTTITNNNNDDFDDDDDDDNETMYSDFGDGEGLNPAFKSIGSKSIFDPPEFLTDFVQSDSDVL